MAKPMHSLVIVAPNWLGDAVMALPAVADVRRQFAGARVHVAARASVAPLYSMVPGVDGVLTLPGRGGWSSILTWRDQADALARGRFDAALLLPNSFASAMAVSRAGIPERWGFATDARAKLLTRPVSKPASAGHHAAYYQALTRALEIPAGPLHPRLNVSSVGRAAARRLLSDAGAADPGRAVVLAPGAAYGRAKQWRPERFAELAALLMGDGIAPVLVGSGADRAVCREIAALARASSSRAGTMTRDKERTPLVDLCGRTDLPTLAGVLAETRACVSNDSGAMHLAAAVGARVVALFGATDERRTAPLASSPDAPAPQVLTEDVWCRPCLLRECPIDHRCMTRISAKRVYEALN